MNKKTFFSLMLLTSVGNSILFSLVVPSYANTTRQTIHEQVAYEDYGTVIENNKELGYITYKNSKGDILTKSYYSGEIVFEKQPFYEAEDRIGYLDEMFPYFEYDVRDQDISQLDAGDHIYIRIDLKDNVQYISAYNDYSMRYGKVDFFDYQSGILRLTDENQRTRVFKVDLTVPVTKGNLKYDLAKIKAGDWIKVLTSNHVLGANGYEEKILEIVVDNDHRVLSNVYRGEFIGVDTYKETLSLRNARRFLGDDFGAYQPMLTLGMSMKESENYYMGNRVTPNYMSRFLKGSQFYVAAENYLGKERAVKTNFQSSQQKILPLTTVVDVDLNQMKLLSGETLFFGPDSILVRENRLVSPQGFMVGDNVEVVVTGGNKVAVAEVNNKTEQNQVQVYRGRISKIDDHDLFEVETMSLLEGGEWFFHPAPKTFSLTANTKFYSKEGFVENGLDAFIAYGDESKYREVFTIVAKGDETLLVSDMPYAKEAIQGEIYQIEDESIKVKDVYVFDQKTDKWELWSEKNKGMTLDIPKEAIIIKEGKIISPKSLEKGDKIEAMIYEEEKTIQGYILLVK